MRTHRGCALGVGGGPGRPASGWGRLAASAGLFAVSATLGMPAAAAGAEPGSAVAVLPGPAPSPGAAPDTLSLSLEEAVAMAHQHHLGLRQARLAVQMQESAVTQERLRFGRRLDASLSHQSTRSPSISSLEQVETATSNVQELGVGLTQQLATGGSVGLSFSNSRASSNAAYRLLDPVYQSRLGVRFVQPLLQGSGRINRTGLEVARPGLESGRVGAQGQEWELTAQVGQAYWALYLARQRQLVGEQLLVGAQRVLEAARVRAELGAGARSSVLDAQVGVAQREQELVTAAGQQRQLQDELKVLLGLDQQPAGWDCELRPARGPELVPFAGQVAEGAARAVARDAGYRQAELEVRRVDLELALAADQARPAVSLAAQGGLSGIGATYADNMAVVRDGDGRSWEGGLELVYPLGQSAGRERVQQLRLQRQQAGVALEQRRLALLQQVRTQHRQVGLSQQREQAAGWTERLAIQSVAEQEERFGLGLATVRNVLDAQDALAQARLSRLQALVDYNNALLEWRRLTGE